MKAKEVFLLLVFLLGITLAPTSVNASSYEDSYNGPYIEKVIYNIINQDDDQVAALQDGTIDLIGGTVDPFFLNTLEADENVEVERYIKNGYGYLTLNTDSYPLNYSVLRRAIAYSVDKIQACADQLEGLADPIDSVLPENNPYSIEGQLEETYYHGNDSYGKNLLSAEGFTDTDSDNYLETPSGADFGLQIKYPSSSPTLSSLAQAVAIDIGKLGIPTETDGVNYGDLMSILDNHGDYDIALIAETFSDFDPRWIADEYWSENVNVTGKNYPDFSNSTYDSYRSALVNGTTHSTIYSASKNMQEIIWHSCPIIPIYSNHLLYAHRNDKYESFINDFEDSIPSYWTNMKTSLLRSLQGPYGGTLNWSLTLDTTSFNFMISNSYGQMINQMLWDTLLVRDWEGDIRSWLATDWTLETNAENASITPGHSVWTLSLVQNATWSDGSPLQADDVAFTLNYYNNSAGNPYGSGLSTMTRANATSDYVLEIEFSTEPYWNIESFAFKPIIPKHVFEIIGTDGWNTWNPDPPNEPMVTSGPFAVTDRVAGQYIELTRVSTHFRHVPMRDDVSYPELNDIADIQYECGSTEHEIVWSPSDDFPHYYEILKDSVTIESGEWDGSQIVVDIDGLSVGQYNYCLVVTDFNGLSTSESTIVTVVDTTNPTIDSPGDMQFSYGDTGNWLEWSPYDINPDEYKLYVNGVLMQSGSWNGSDLRFNIDDLAVGEYSFTLWVYDTVGLNASDTVSVTVLSDTTTTSTTTSTTTTTTSTTSTPIPPLNPMLLAGGGLAVVGIIVIALVVLRKR